MMLKRGQPRAADERDGVNGVGSGNGCRLSAKKKGAAASAYRRGCSGGSGKRGALAAVLSSPVAAAALTLVLDARYPPLCDHLVSACCSC